MKTFHLIVAAAAFCPLGGLLAGCGAGGVLAAANNIANNGVGFSSKVVDPGSAVPAPRALDQTSSTAIASGPVSTISATQSANIISQLGSGGHIKDVNAALTLSISKPNTQVGLVITQNTLNNSQFWQAAGVGGSRDGVSVVNLGTVITFLQPGTYVFGPAGVTIPSGAVYGGDLLGASASADVLMNNAGLQALKTQFETMLRNGQPISIYLESFDPTGTSVATISGLNIQGHSTISV